MLPPVDDLGPGTVLHIKGYSSRNQAPKDKFLIIIGSSSEDEILGFLISSQLFYLENRVYKDEVVRIPHNATTFLRKESIIQCFEIERLDRDAIVQGINSKVVSKRGKLSAKYLHRIRDAVRSSDLLAQRDIEDAIRVLPKEA